MAKYHHASLTKMGKICIDCNLDLADGDIAVDRSSLTGTQASFAGLWQPVSHLHAPRHRHYVSTAEHE